MSAKAGTVVLVHGAWHGSWCWDRVAPLLEAQRLRVRTVDLPSVGADPAAGADLSGDAAVVQTVLDDADGPVLLCGHSYGGMVVTHAAAGHPNVERLVYLCAFMPDEGESLVQLTGGAPAPWIRVGEDGMTLPDLEQAPTLFYGDCEPEIQAHATSRIRPMAAAPFLESVRSPAWKHVPATYVVCTQDRAIPVELQRGVFAPRAHEAVELDSSHSPFLSKPEVVADLLASRLLQPA